MNPVYAVTFKGAEISKCADTKGFPGAPPIQCLSGTITTAISLVFSAVGVVALIYLFTGAIKYITSSGDQKALKSAKETMTYATIGLVIVLSVYWIANIFANMFYNGAPSDFFNFSLGTAP